MAATISGGSARGSSLSRARLRLVLWLFVSTVVSVVMLFLAIRGVNLDEVGHALKGASLPQVVAGGLLLLAIYPLNALRWRIIARDLDPPGLGVMMELVFAGAATTNAFPGRLGEPARALGLARLTRRPFLQAFGTVAADRIADVVVACLALVATMAMVPHPAWVTWIGIGGTVVALLGIVAIVVAVRVSPSVADEPRWRHHLRSLAVGGRSLRSGRVIGAVLALTVIAWLAWGIGAWLVARSLGVHLSATAVAFTFAALALGSAIPSAPGFVGTYHWIAANALQLFGVPAEQSVAFAVLLHALWFVPSTVIGLAAMMRLGLGFSEVRRVRVTAAENEPLRVAP